MRLRPLLLAIAASAVLAAPSLRGHAAEPAVHANQGTHAAAKAGATQPGAAAVNGAVTGSGVGPRGPGNAGRPVHDARQGAAAVHGSATASGGGVRPGPIKPGGTLGVGAVQGSGAPVRNTAQINGTGMARKGVGPASIGAAVKPRTGINGTGLGK